MKTNTIYNSLGLVSIVLTLVLAGCGKKDPAHAQAEQAATDAALAWLDLIDKGTYAESWQQSATPFRNATTAEGWGNMVKPIRDPMGKMQSREAVSREYTTSLPNAPVGEYVVIQFKTDFENKKGAIETVTPMKEDGEWKVSGYYIR